MAKNNGKETSIDIAVTDEGVVVLRFGMLIREFRLTPELATSIGLGLIQWATRADSLRRMQPPGHTAVGPRRKQ
jgi:hypothetical protein